MALKHYTEKNAVQLLATQSRRTDINSLELCNVHYEMGKYLAYQMLDDFKLHEIDIQHVQGVKKGKALINKEQIAIISMMRSGLYAAEGVRSIFSESMFIIESADIKSICTKYEMGNKTVIVIDAVINTGKTIKTVLDTLIINKCSRIIVATLLMQNEALSLADLYKDVSFYVLRVSENKYVGKGKSDTGNRLFNT